MNFISLKRLVLLPLVFALFSGVAIAENDDPMWCLGYITQTVTLLNDDRAINGLDEIRIKVYDKYKSIGINPNSYLYKFDDGNRRANFDFSQMPGDMLAISRNKNILKKCSDKINNFIK